MAINLTLKLQEYLREHGIDKLQEQLGINVYRHPSLPLVGFKYSQFDSPRTDPVVRECRGIVLEDKTWRLVAKPFNRFFNVGEVADEFAKFDWDNFDCVSKEDGSLVILYYYGGPRSTPLPGSWEINTSGSFAFGDAPFYGGSWRKLFMEFAGIYSKLPWLNPDTTYCFELCTPYNKVVKRYEKPSVFLIGMTHNRTLIEASEEEITFMAGFLGVKSPIRYYPFSKESVMDILIRMEEDSDELHEGVIIRDKNGQRFKWKTKKYLALHRLKDNGNVLQPRRLVDIILGGETSEVLTVMPEITTAMNEVRTELAIVLATLTKLWLENKDAPSQKEFALAVKNHPLAFILFNMRKKCGDGFVHQEKLNRLVRENSQKVAEKIFGNRTFTFDLEV